VAATGGVAALQWPSRRTVAELTTRTGGAASGVCAGEDGADLDTMVRARSALVMRRLANFEAEPLGVEGAEEEDIIGLQRTTPSKPASKQQARSERTSTQRRLRPEVG
jgi:hypothetical protein